MVPGATEPGSWPKASADSKREMDMVEILSEALAGVGNADNAFATLATFEKSVAKEEATAKAFGELASAGKDDGLEAEFAALQGATVDSELEELKRERRIGSVHIQKELPPASGH